MPLHFYHTVTGHVEADQMANKERGRADLALGCTYVDLDGVRERVLHSNTRDLVMDELLHDLQGSLTEPQSLQCVQ